MCGLVGIAGQGIQHSDLKILDDLSHVIALRGTDGAGIIQGKTPYYGKGVENLILEKDRWDISYFKQRNKWAKDGNDKIFTDITNNFFAVHVRAATIGAINKENAHPFDAGPLIGMHNGTLKDKRYESKTTTDSEKMFHDMADRGVSGVLKSLNKESAYAVIILDKESGLLTFARNAKRPLFFCFHATRAVMYWASEDWMLRGILDRNGEKTKNDTIYYFLTDTLYHIDPARVPRNINDLVTEELSPKVTPKKDKSVQSVISFHEKREEAKQKRDKTKQETRTSVASSVVNQQPLGIGRVIPSMYCCGCHKPLTLVEQYFGAKIDANSPNSILCENCDNEAKKLVLIN